MCWGLTVTMVREERKLTNRVCRHSTTNAIY